MLEHIKTKYAALLEKIPDITDQELKQIAEVTPDSMIIHFDNLDFLQNEYTPAEIGQLIFALRDYARSGLIPPIEDKSLRIVFMVLQDRLKYDLEKRAERIILQRLKGRIPKKE